MRTGISVENEKEAKADPKSCGRQLEDLGEEEGREMAMTRETVNAVALTVGIAGVGLIGYEAGQGGGPVQLPSPAPAAAAPATTSPISKQVSRTGPVNEAPPAPLPPVAPATAPSPPSAPESVALTASPDPATPHALHVPVAPAQVTPVQSSVPVSFAPVHLGPSVVLQASNVQQNQVAVGTPTVGLGQTATMVQRTPSLKVQPLLPTTSHRLPYPLSNTSNRNAATAAVPRTIAPRIATLKTIAPTTTSPTAAAPADPSQEENQGELSIRRPDGSVDTTVFIRDPKTGETREEYRHLNHPTRGDDGQQSAVGTR